jgi:Smg protein
MFDILMYLFENYIHSEMEVVVNHDELTDELTRAGFHRQEIHKALVWLERLTELQECQTKPYLNRSPNSATRVYTAEETARLDVDSRGFLMYLENLGVLDFSTREMVVDRVMELDTQQFSVEDLKWVVLMVLFNVPGHEAAYDQMEGLLFEQAEGLLH